MKKFAKYFLFISLFVNFRMTAVGQGMLQNKKQNTLYFELLGSGGLYSLNYERVFTNFSKINYGFRVGGSFWNRERPNINSIVEGLIITGSKNHHLDLGMGLNIGSGPNSDFSNYVSQFHIYMVPRLSYRFQRPTGGSVVRLGLTPFVALTKKTPDRFYTYPLYVGISVGHAF
ncbi:hypothetical protein [Spirosoma utsteinense]|uniref:Outer membrane protein beta-barrel domain-containing protein n=1 Tax=Spirosoma utsteinense TaxID=2585773 RepID=A0ABR6WF41_9BACT|nr:hypothetical protein [Spirosoma utsteinense]MBC3795113.1 hypothetical protein [Spirosoma utsteinense]